MTRESDTGAGYRSLTGYGPVSDLGIRADKGRCSADAVQIPDTKGSVSGLNRRIPGTWRAVGIRYPVSVEVVS